MGRRLTEMERLIREQAVIETRLGKVNDRIKNLQKERRQLLKQLEENAEGKKQAEINQKRDKLLSVLEDKGIGPEQYDEVFNSIV